MEPSELEHLKEIFYEAIQQSTGQRAEFLAEACGSDERLRAEVTRLLAEHDCADGFLDSPFSSVLSIPYLADSKANLETNRTIAGRYRIVSLLGEGGMGVVYKAEDTRLSRFVALKSLNRSVAEDAASLERLRREARAASGLNHPNICTIHDVVESEGHTFIVMEYLDGETLKEMIRGGQFSANHGKAARQDTVSTLDNLLRIATQIIEGLGAAHDKGIVHRDIKPANIFVTKAGLVKLLDFGIAKITRPSDNVVALAEAEQSQLKSEAHLTNTGVAAGTIGYMSPEQLSAKELDARTDLFSFGTVLYEVATGTKPFGARSTKLPLDSILNQDVVPVVRVNPNLPLELDEIIAKCLQKDRDLRYQNASELRADLQALRGRLESVNREIRKTASGFNKSRAQWIIGAAAVAAVALTVFIWRSKAPSFSSVDSATLKPIAVLPFQSVRLDENTDFLRLALPDEIATTLTYVPTFSVRPFAATRKYTESDLDLQKVGRDIGVSSIVTGHYLADGGQLEITLEAVDVATNRSVWRDTVSVTASDKIALREQITARVLQGLVPMLGGQSSGEHGTRPKDEQAYDLYLRSIAIQHDGPLNDQGISMLQQTVGLDPNYAPAWEALGRRYYVSSEYGGQGDPARKRSEIALERALALDPDLISAASQLIMQQAERGDVRHAYAQAAALVQHHPTSAAAHFAMSYAFRYAGMLQESARECNSALALDRSNYELRGCSGTFLQLGNTARAMDFVRLDAGSQYAALQTAGIFLAQGKVADALQTIRKTSNSPWMGRDLIEACLVPDSPSECARTAQTVEKAGLEQVDVEVRYANGTLLSYCGQQDAAVRVIKNAIENGYCANTHLESDPMLVKLRGTPQFSELMLSAKQCQKTFLASQAGDPTIKLLIGTH